ncbi:MAG: ABC transporter ATP-binding protein [Proteobacteria bacterium]|nr:ABC transporter ATP-binding protein [Pseudomonadota bacterium]
MIEVEGLRVVYRDVISVLHGVSVSLEDGQITTLLGANGAGKTTLLRTLSGVLHIYDGDVLEGSVRIDGQDVTRLNPVTIARKFGIVYIVEERTVFPQLNVMENLKCAASSRRDREVNRDVGRVFELFPALTKRLSGKAGYMSGGEQQMLSIGNALMTRPKILLLDEPSLGLAPILVREMFKVIERINKEDAISMFLIEQNAAAAMKVAHKGYVMENGRVVLEGTRRELESNEDIKEFYLGSGSGEKKDYRQAKRYKRRKRWLG